MDKILYEKHYPKDEESDFTEIEKTDPTDAERKSAREFFQELADSTEYHLLPERKEGAVRFVKAAIGVSELYELDLKLVKHDSHIAATLSFDIGGGMSALKPLLALGDDFAFFTEIHDKDITMCIDYYTHEVVRKGRKVAPIEWEFN